MFSLKRWSFNRMSLNARVALVVVVVIAGLVGLTVMNAFESRTRQMEGLERTLRSEIESAISVATAYDKRAAAGEFSAAEAKRLALRQIEDMQWDEGTGYIFAFDTGLTMRMHPLKKKLVGQSIAKETDAKGKPHYRLMVEGNLKNGHTLIRYTQIMPDGSGKDKITYSQLFKPWDLNFSAGAWVAQGARQVRHELPHQRAGVRAGHRRAVAAHQAPRAPQPTA